MLYAGRNVLTCGRMQRALASPGFRVTASRSPECLLSSEPVPGSAPVGRDPVLRRETAMQSQVSVIDAF